MNKAKVVSLHSVHHCAQVVDGSRDAFPEKGGEDDQIPDEILTTVKKTVLHFGGFKPSLFVRGTKAKVYLSVPFGETNDQRIDIMIRAGIQRAKESQVGDVEQVVYVTEAWVSPARDKYVQPSQDPDRMEVLIFNSLDGRTGAQTLEMYACVRNWKQEVTGLRPVPQPDGGAVEGRLLASFMAGFTLFKR